MPVPAEAAPPHQGGTTTSQSLTATHHSATTTVHTATTTVHGAGGTVHHTTTTVHTATTTVHGAGGTVHHTTTTLHVTTTTHPGATPCWVSLLNDSYGGAITRIYPLHCYGEAIKHLPAVATIYGSEKQEIQAAEAAAARGKLAKGVVIASTTTTSTKKATGISSWLDKLNPGSANAFPTPLLILGALAILLVIAGIAGMLWQRSHPRDSGPPAPS
jgi:hypothetical protein